MTVTNLRNTLRYSGPLPVELTGSEWMTILAGLGVLSEREDGMEPECERLFNKMFEQLPDEITDAVDRLVDLKEAEQN